MELISLAWAVSQDLSSQISLLCLYMDKCATSPPRHLKEMKGKERERLTFLLLVHSKRLQHSGLGQEPLTLSGSLTQMAETEALGPFSDLSKCISRELDGTQISTLKWDVGNVGGSLTCCSTLSAPI